MNTTHLKPGKTLMALLLALGTLPVALPATAGDFGSVFAQPMGLIAQLSGDERRALRERWEEASPEERAELRRNFQQRLRQLPPERMDPREMGENMRRAMPAPANDWIPSGFGTGYEHRREDEDRRGRR
jgi:hypothetical protein